jgi:LuxR family maltose regulon positive regulatory protein
MATDVLQTLPAGTRAFLLKTCILGRLCGSLCDAVARIEGSGAILRDLSRANLFITPIGGAGEWYRYHQLFAEALRLELRVARPDLIAVVHTRASAWFEQEGDLESATGHAIAARDIRLSGRLILRQLRPFVAEGRVATVDRWLAGLSWPQAQRDPELAAARAVAAGMSSRLEDAEEWLDVAAEGPGDAMTEAGVPLGFIVDLLRSFYALRRVPRAYESALRALDQAPAPAWRGFALTGAGQCLHLLGRPSEAAGALREAMSLLPDDPYIVSVAAGYLALAECDMGTAERGERLARRMVELLDSRNLARMGPDGICHLGLGAALKAQGRLADAQAELSLAVELCRSTRPSLWHAHALIVLADARHAAGDTGGATGALDQADAILERLPEPGAVPDLAAAVRERLSAPARRPVDFGQELSEREVTVLRLLKAGLSQREIAEQLYISHNTVKTHLRTIYRKLGAHSRASALECAKEFGML